MADLSVEICGLRFANPVLTAAGPRVWNGEAMAACASGGAGGIVSKTVSVHPAVVPTPNMAEIPGGFLNTELWSELPVEQFIEREYALAKQTGLPLIVSLGYSAEEVSDLAPRVRPFADALELSTHYLGDDLQPMTDAVEAARRAVDVPVLVKLSPFGDVASAAKAAAEAGADGFAAVNSFGPCLGVDAETGRLLLGSEDGYGWLSGQAAVPGWGRGWRCRSLRSGDDRRRCVCSQLRPGRGAGQGGGGREHRRRGRPLRDDSGGLGPGGLRSHGLDDAPEGGGVARWPAQ